MFTDGVLYEVVILGCLHAQSDHGFRFSVFSFFFFLRQRFEMMTRSNGFAFT